MSLLLFAAGGCDRGPELRTLPDDVGARHAGPPGAASAEDPPTDGRRYALFDEQGSPCAFASTEAALCFVLDAPKMPAATISCAWARFQGGATLVPSPRGAPDKDDGEIAPP